MACADPMDRRVFILCLLAAVSAFSSAVGAAPQDLVRVDGGGVQAARWRARLDLVDLNAREQVFGELVAAARRSASLVMTLERWALDSRSPALAWTARLALRELDTLQAPTRGLRIRWISNSPRAPGLQTSTPLSTAGLRQLTPPYTSPFGEAPALSLLMPRGFAFPEARVRVSVRQTHALRVQAEGVSLTVSQPDGSCQIYAAGSLEELLAEHPGLVRKVPGLSELARQGVGEGLFYQWNDISGLAPSAGTKNPGAHAHSPGHLAAAERTSPSSALSGGLQAVSILGVQCRPVSAEAGLAGGLGPGVGLRIERRVPGTVAEALGLSRNDILVEVNGQALCGVPSLSQALAQVNRSGAIVLKILDRAGLERTLTWIPIRP